MTSVTWFIRYTKSYVCKDITILDDIEELTAEEFIRSIGNVRKVCITCNTGSPMDEIFVCNNDIWVIPSSCKKLSELNHFWNKRIEELTVNKNIPGVVSISNFCKYANKIISEMNILGICPPKYRSKIISMPFPDKWKKSQYIPECEYQILWGQPKDSNLNDIHKIYVLNAELTPLKGTFGNIRIDWAHVSDLMELEAYSLNIKYLCVDCWRCSKKTQIEQLTHFLSNVKTHKLIIRIVWENEFDQQLINITSCHLRAYDIWINERRVSIRSLNQAIKRSIDMQYSRVKSSRNVG